MTEVDPQAPYCAACSHHGTDTHDPGCWAVGEVLDDEFNFDPVSLAAALLEARAENERLREALERISSEDFRGVLPEVIARAALSPKEDLSDD